MLFFRKKPGDPSRIVVEMNRLEFTPYRRLLPLTMVLILLALAPQWVCGQEALRQSLAGESAAQAQKDAAATIGYYNLLLGNVALRASSGMGVQYNDNIHLQNNNPQGDFIF